MVQIEPLTAEHLGSPYLAPLLPREAHAKLLSLNGHGGVAIVATSKDGAFGLGTVFPESGEVMVFVHRKFQKSGVGTALAEQAVDLAFRDRKMTRLWGKTLPGRAGSKLAGRFHPRTAMKNGEKIFELTREEWHDRGQPTSAVT
jgi:GNAT superfamily N-acetyltransferase